MNIRTTTQEVVASLERLGDEGFEFTWECHPVKDSSGRFDFFIDMANGLSALVSTSDSQMAARFIVQDYEFENLMADDFYDFLHALLSGNYTEKAGGLWVRGRFTVTRRGGAWSASR